MEFILYEWVAVNFEIIAVFRKSVISGDQGLYGTPMVPNMTSVRITW